MIDHDDIEAKDTGPLEVLVTRDHFENLMMGVFAAGLVMGMFLTIFAFWVALNGLH